MGTYVDSFPGRVVRTNNRKYLYFGGTAYLGLQTYEHFQQLFIENIKKYGTNYGASRKSNVRISIFDTAEAYLAKLVGSEACTTVSSGYLAGQFVAQALNSKKNRFFYAPNTHSALYPVQTRSYTTFTALNIAVREHLRSQGDTSVPIVFLDAIDFSGCNYPDFQPLQLLPLDRLILVVDDSHGIGILGEKGGGVYRSLLRMPIKELIVCASLGKGFGIQGGAVFATAKRIDKLMETPFFGGASPATPAALATVLDAEDIFAEKRRQLRSNIELFLEAIDHPKKFSFMKDHPAFSFSDAQLVEFLEQNGILLTCFPYPDEQSQVMSRIVISAHHREEDILRLASLLNQQRV